VREAQWAIIQHYGLWPTPLIDLTLNLRVAASFAFHGNNQENDDPSGHVFVVGMPDVSGSITHDVRERVVLTRLQSACPPAAKRPHYQEGFLVGHYPFYNLRKNSQYDLKDESDLNRRLIAVFRLDNHSGNFWSDFPKYKRSMLYPDHEDKLLERFKKEFGENGGELQEKARSLT
jgi:hypothetical protein